jgi:hypothetical protein
MNIDRMGSGQEVFTGKNNNRQLQNGNEKENNPHINTSDSFQSVSQDKISGKLLTDLVSKVNNIEGLQKSKYHYELAGVDQSPEGTIYSAYTDFSHGEGNYISALSPDGTIKWETRAADDPIIGITTAKDGSVYTRTVNHIIAFDPDGQQKFKHELKEKIYRYSLDSEGNCYAQTFGGKLYMLDNAGNKLDTPDHLKEMKFLGLLVHPDGNLWCMTVNDVKKFKLDDTKIQQYQFRQGYWSAGEQVLGIRPASGGGVFAATRMEKQIPGYPDKIHDRKTVEEHFVTKLDSNGKQVWKTPDLGEKLNFAYTTDDRVLFTSTKQNEDGKYGIHRIEPDGKYGLLASVDHPVVDFKLRPSDNHIFARMNNGMVSEFDTNGNLIGSTRLDKKMEFRGFTDDGRVLLEKDRKEFHIWNPGDRSTKRITNHSLDHSYKIDLKSGKLANDIKEALLKDMEDDTSKSPKQKEQPVQIKDDHVIVGGVKLKKKNSGGKNNQK